MFFSKKNLADDRPEKYDLIYSYLKFFILQIFAISTKFCKIFIWWIYLTPYLKFKYSNNIYLYINLVYTPKKTSEQFILYSSVRTLTKLYYAPLSH